MPRRGTSIGNLQMMRRERDKKKLVESLFS